MYGLYAARLLRLVDRFKSLEIAQNGEGRPRRGEMLEGVPAHEASGRINHSVCELKQLGERIEHSRGNPVTCSGAFSGIQQKQRYYSKSRKKLHPEIEPQIVDPAPQQQADQADR